MPIMAHLFIYRLIVLKWSTKVSQTYQTRICFQAEANEILHRDQHCASCIHHCHGSTRLMVGEKKEIITNRIQVRQLLVQLPS